ncbi:uncharacterized protein LOC129804817 [Phlebotomus papatasi]|uniref:uncharacterized protein LOC129804817 n=1 Tax=Phlebotomus papatasi TaxID=29031 RepID=UPI0024833D02|nr:uncharacterized protein LOC129804817 [Phlebotomus papatasi]
MFSRVSNKTLAKIAVYGAFGAISAVFYMRYSIEKRLRGQEYYTNALKLLQNHTGAVGLLGQPVRDRGFDLSDKVNFCDGREAHFEVTVRGSKDRGTYYFWARREAQQNTEDSKPATEESLQTTAGAPKGTWDIYRAELELKSKPDQRLVIKN